MNVDGEQYNCDSCMASCTFEAMMQCQESVENCPTLQLLKTGVIVDKRPTDFDPKFPSAFTWNKP